MVQLLYVEEATDLVYTELEEFTGWKFLKSQRCLKRKIKDIELYIKFSTSKWNKSHEYVGLNASPVFRRITCVIHSVQDSVRTRPISR